MLPPSELDRVLTAARVRVLRARSPRVLPAAARFARDLPGGTRSGGRRFGPAYARRKACKPEPVPGSTRGGAIRTTAPSGGGHDGQRRYRQPGAARERHGGAPQRHLACVSAHVQLAEPARRRRQRRHRTEHVRQRLDEHVRRAYLRQPHGTISVWDIDGARYDYALAADGVTRIPPPGQHATLTLRRRLRLSSGRKSPARRTIFGRPTGQLRVPASWRAYGAYAASLTRSSGATATRTSRSTTAGTTATARPAGKISQDLAQTESGLTATFRLPTCRDIVCCSRSFSGRRDVDGIRLRCRRQPHVRQRAGLRRSGRSAVPRFRISSARDGISCSMGDEPALDGNRRRLHRVRLSAVRARRPRRSTPSDA